MLRLRPPLKRAMRAWLLFEGRIGRVGLLLRFCFAFLALLTALECLPESFHPNSWRDHLGTVVGTGALALFLWVSMGLQIRRLHDLSLHGLWVAVPWMTVLLGSWFSSTRGLPAGDSQWLRFVLLPFWGFLLLMPGRANSNRFGAPPSGV